MKTNFDNWFWEIDGDQVRSEKFWNAVDCNRRREIYQWLQSAYDMGYNEAQRLYGEFE